VTLEEFLYLGGKAEIETNLGENGETAERSKRSGGFSPVIKINVVQGGICGGGKPQSEGLCGGRRIQEKDSGA